LGLDEFVRLVEAGVLEVVEAGLERGEAEEGPSLM
jgi:hypothetical protein